MTGTRTVNHIVTSRLCCLLLSLTLWGCTYTASVDPQELPTPLVERIPASIGVYYPPELVNHEKVVPLFSDGQNVAFNLGPPSISVFDQAFSYSFTDVRRVSSRPPFSTDVSDLDAVIEVNIDRFTPQHIDWNEYTVSITYVVTLWQLDGSQLATWRSSQSSNLDLEAMDVAVRVLPRHGSDFGRIAADAIGDVAADFLRSFSRHPSVQAWTDSLERPADITSRD